MGYRWRRKFCPGRPRKERIISEDQSFRRYICEGSPTDNMEIALYFDEMEALKLVDLEGLSQEEAGKRMNISRGTIWRLLEQGRRKIIDALIKRKTITIKQREE